MPRSRRNPEPELAFRLAPAPPNLFAGTSGWAYPTWRPDFYPDRLAPKRFLPFYASQMNSVEVNYTFRALPSAKAIEEWIRATPDEFRFSFKAPQRVTHFRRLQDCDADMAQLLGLLPPFHSAGKMGLLLFQLPPNFRADAERLRKFLGGPAFQTTDVPPIAFEFRDPSWFTAEIEAILRDHNAALCIAESDDLKTPEIHTAATHVSFRLRRNGGYKKAELAVFAKRFLVLSRTREVYIYFKHEEEPTGALNGMALLKRALLEAGSLR